MRGLILTVLLWSSTFAATAATQVSLWHTYTNPAGEVHFAFDLKDLKRGVFFGSCGMSTRSLQWEYGFDLTGKGPQFSRDTIRLKDGSFNAVAIDSGNIAVDETNRTIQISLIVSTNGATQQFIGNGTYKLRSKL